MENPVVAIRKNKGLTVAELALMADVSIPTVRKHQSGVTKYINPKLMMIFEKWGYEKEKIDKDYEAWRKTRALELLEG